MEKGIKEDLIRAFKTELSQLKNPQHSISIYTISNTTSIIMLDFSLSSIILKDYEYFSMGYQFGDVVVLNKSEFNELKQLVDECLLFLK